MTLRDQPCFEDLADAIRAFARGRNVVTILNTGNWGDALVHAGLAEFLDDCGVSCQWFFVSEFTRRRRTKLKSFLFSRFLPKRAIIAAAGAIRDDYPKQMEKIGAATRAFEQVLFVPSSFPVKPDFDLSKSQLWRRDAGESMAVLPEARFCHDMAFYLSPRPRKASRKLGLLFRDDAERGDFELPANNLDISAEGTHKSDTDLFFDRVGEYEVIATNRLHVGIAGALLGREVHLFSGNNDKVRSIYESSMRPFYKNVHFHVVPPSPEWLASLNRGNEVDAF